MNFSFNFVNGDYAFCQKKEISLRKTMIYYEINNCYAITKTNALYTRYFFKRIDNKNEVEPDTNVLKLNISYMPIPAFARSNVIITVFRCRRVRARW